MTKLFLFLVIFTVVIVLISILMYQYAYQMVVGLQIDWWQGPSSTDLLIVDITNSSSK